MTNRPATAAEFQARANAVLARYGAPLLSLQDAAWYQGHTSYSVRQAVAICLDVDPTNY